MQSFIDISCEEYYSEIQEEYIFVTKEDLPSATYLGGDEWVGTDGRHFIVIDL